MALLLVVKTSVLLTAMLHYKSPATPLHLPSTMRQGLVYSYSCYHGIFLISVFNIVFISLGSQLSPMLPTCRLDVDFARHPPTAAGAVLLAVSDWLEGVPDRWHTYLERSSL